MRTGGVLTLLVIAAGAAFSATFMPAQAQTAEERYLAARDAAIERFTPQRAPKEKDFASAVKLASDLLARIQVK